MPPSPTMIYQGHDAVQRGGDRRRRRPAAGNSVEDALPVAGDEDRKCADGGPDAAPRHPALRARGRCRTSWPLKDSRIKISSASTITLNVGGSSSAAIGFWWWFVFFIIFFLLRSVFMSTSSSIPSISSWAARTATTRMSNWKPALTMLTTVDGKTKPDVVRHQLRQQGPGQGYRPGKGDAWLVS